MVRSFLPHTAMSDKVQTGISITTEAYNIVERLREEYGLNFSAALELIIRQWQQNGTKPERPRHRGDGKLQDA